MNEITQEWIRELAQARHERDQLLAEINAIREALDESQFSSEPLHNVAYKLRADLAGAQAESHKNFTMAVTYMKERDEAQRRECAMREAIEYTLKRGQEGYVSFCGMDSTKRKLENSILTPAPVGWVKLRWRPGTERPRHMRTIVAQVGEEIWCLTMDENQWNKLNVKRWLYADELLEKGTQ